ncbi:MAG: hypothetical protein AB1586_02780 [Pseudomonadota bacterium]
MLFGRPDAFGNRHSARIYLDEDHLDVMREQRPDAVAVHVIRDRFSLKQIPIIYYNARFGLPSPPVDQDFLAQWPKRDFQAITEFQLHTRGIELDAAQLEGFERGDWIAIVPAHGDEGKAGSPGQGTIGRALTKALYAHCVRASRVLQAAQFRSQRQRHPKTRFDEEFRDQLETSELAEVKAAFSEVSRLYQTSEVEKEREITTDHIRTAGRSLVIGLFNLTPAEIRSQASLEILCYEQIYGPFTYQAVADRELPIVRVLRHAQLRALTSRRIAREAAKYQVAKGAPVKPGTKARLMFGEEFDLNLWGCFISALYGGFNPAALYGEFESFTDLFDLGAWFGYFARGDYEVLPPEIAATLVSCLSSRPEQTATQADASDLEKIYSEIRYLTKLLVGEERLREAAQQATKTRTSVVVPPLYYHAVTTPSTAEPDAPDAALDQRFKVGTSHEEIILLVDYDNFPEMTKDELLSIRRFRPLLW